ncbi:prolyl aminopeptidase [Motiliproteus sp. SC1-56]|uniref:prolyl aminopeptidase n=1 Tax=Motiliproteus sp. SC1-56 TaxID=2799565 RepID=UPI001A902E73|nr:prolyl aminopeptidase [Motiliproteus sp. SC1-56]
MLTLYPEIQPHTRHFLAVDPPHQIYVEESGNPKGIPVLVVHGGPGSGSSDSSRCFFNPQKYRIILFDQRGCGRSVPHGSLEKNTTAHLIGDMEAIRLRLNIDQWLLFGGSWGSSLSLAYAQVHPERVAGLILRGIFLCRQADVQWLFQRGASRFFPDHWREFLEPIPEPEQDDLVGAYYRRLMDNNEIARMAAAKAWSVWEARCSTLAPNTELVEQSREPHFALAQARIETHYFVHKAFMEEGQLLSDAHRIAHIPTVIVHGRYDMVCPIEQAFELYQALPDAELHIVRNAGHSAQEPGITDNLIKATRQFAERLA